MEKLPLLCVYDGVSSDGVMICCHGECGAEAVADYTVCIGDTWFAFVGACTDHLEDLAVFAMADEWAYE
jgi:hypothetical protein